MVKWAEHRRKIIQKKGGGGGGEKKKEERENQINTVSSRHSSVCKRYQSFQLNHDL